MKLSGLFFAFLVLYTLHVQAQKSASPSVIKELVEAETKMFNNVKYSTAQEYFKTDVSDDFFTINADGVSANKAEMLADTTRLKMFEMANIKVKNRKVSVYGNVGITNGLAQAFVNDTMVAEFLYTTVFVKQKGKWMYTRWHGTMSRNTPMVPATP